MKLKLTNVSYEGPRLSSLDALEGLPEDYAELLVMINGFVQFAGGLHVRGVCEEPDWHSLHTVRDGSLALHRHYPAVSPEDLPFGQDALGDQFILRGNTVHRLNGETGGLADLGASLPDFLEAAQADPIAYLSLEPLAQFYEGGGRLEPGQLLNIIPPLCIPESAEGVSMRAVPALKRLRFLAEFSHRFSGKRD